MLTLSKRTLSRTIRMADLNLKNIRAAYKGREEGINDSGRLEFIQRVYTED